jgi:WD40 repeat protein
VRVADVPETAEALAWSPDGRSLAAYTFSELVKVFGEDGGPPRVIGGFEAPSSAGKIFFSGRGDALVAQLPLKPEIRVVSFPEGKEVRRLGADLLGWPPNFGDWSAHPDGILFWPRDTGWFPAMTPHKAPGTWRLWPWDGGALRELGRSSGELTVATDRDHRWLALTRGNKVYLRPHEGPLGTPEREVASFKPLPFPPWLDMSPDGGRLAVVDEPDHVTVWPLAPGAARRARRLALGIPSAGYFSLAWDDRGTRLVGRDVQGEAVLLWDLEGPPDAGPLRLLRPDGGNAQKAFHPRGGWLAVADTELALWAVAQPWVRVLGGHASGGVVHELAFTPDSRWLVSCGADMVRRSPLDAAAGEAAAIENLGSELTVCYGLAISPDGSQVLRGAGGVKLVNLHGHKSAVTAVALSPDGKWVASACGPEIRLWPMPDLAKTPPHALPYRDHRPRA